MITDIVAPKFLEKIDKLRPKQNSKKLSIIKSISWRIVGSLDTMLVSYLFTGSIKLAVSISSFELVSKITLFYFHERAWLRIAKK